MPTNLADNQEVKPFAIEDTKKPQTVGVEQFVCAFAYF